MTGRGNGVMRVLTSLLAGLLALVGAVLAYAVVAGKLPPELARRSLAAGHGHSHAHDHGSSHDDAAGACCEAEQGHAAVAATASASATEAAATDGPAENAVAAAPGIKRFSICEREEARVSLRELQLRSGGPPLLAIGCGSSLQLLGFERFGEAIEPRRLLELQLPVRSPAEAPHALEAFAADVDGDGRLDLVASALLVDASGSPRGGGLFVAAQRAEGSFDAARRLLELAPLDVAAATFDTAAGQDLLLLNGGDARLSRPNALWLVTGGPSPVSAAIRAGSVGSSAIAACDLDGDGLDELIEGGSSDGLLRIWPSGVAAGAEPRTLAVSGVRELSCVPDEGRRRAVVVAGDQLSLLRAGPDTAPQMSAIATDGASLRDLHALDLDADGALELVAYAHPDLLAWSRQGDHYVQRKLAKLTGQVAVLDAHLLQLGGGSAPELVVLTAAEDSIAVSVTADVASGSTVTLHSDTVPALESPLLQRIVLR